jgi:hypothetical protein
MMIMPPMSDPSEPSERMERADNPSKTMTYALIFGGLTAAAAAAYFLTRTKRTPLPSAEEIAAGAVPGVSLASTGDTTVQIGLKSESNPFGTTSTPVSAGALYAQKMQEIRNWSRPLLAFALGVPMGQASMAGYRMGGPLDFLQDKVSDAQKGLSNLQSGLQKVESEAVKASRTLTQQRIASEQAAKAAAASADPDPYGWAQVRSWLSTGRLALDTSKPAWNETLFHPAAVAAQYFDPSVLPLLGDYRTWNAPPNQAQIDAMHRMMRQMYDLWTRGGADATATPAQATFAPLSRTRTLPFRTLQSDYNKG